ncbi:MAG: hypothetical protein N2449_00500 [Bacteroidales bacterium]|nr:hypothetical protein [Bacteroidales bacterium]
MELNKTNIELLVKEIYAISGYNFFDYSFKSLARRVEKILEFYECGLEELIERMRKNPLIVEQVVKEITVNTTEFFRDPIVWIELEQKILPELAKRNQIKIWHAGCSYGHEAYSMLILLNEHQLLKKATLIATDINADVLQAAKKGTFRYFIDMEHMINYEKVINKNMEHHVPYTKYFIVDEAKNILNIRPEFLNYIKFYKHDLVTDSFPPDEEFDLIMCRNLLIYFNLELQNKVIYKFFKSLKPDSFLVLGYYEAILGTVSNNFLKSGQVYKKIK